MYTLGNCSCVALPSPVHGLVRFFVDFCLALWPVHRSQTLMVLQNFDVNVGSNSFERGAGNGIVVVK